MIAARRAHVDASPAVKHGGDTGCRAVRAPWGALRDWPLRRKAAALFFVSAVFPSMFVAGLLLQRERTTLRTAKLDLLQARVDEVGHTLEAMHRDYQGNAARAARNREIVRFCTSTAGERTRLNLSLQERLEVIRGDHPAVRGLGVIDRNGTVVSSTIPVLIGMSLAFRDYFQRAVVGAEAVHDLYVSVSATGRIPTIPYAEPIRTASGDIVGVYVLWVNAQAVWDAMRAANGNAGPGSYFILFDRYGIRIGHSANDSLLFHPTAPIPPETERAMLASKRFGERTTELLGSVVPFPLEEIRGNERHVVRRMGATNHVWSLAVARDFPALGWTLVTQIPETAIEVPISSLLPSAAAVCLFGLVLALVGGALLMRQVIRPIGHLAVAAVALKRGTFTPEQLLDTVDVTAHDEVGQLARAFSSMAATLADRDHSLRERNNDLKQVLDNVGQGFLTMDVHGAVSQERSAIVDHWFGEMNPNEPVWSYLGREDADFAVRMQHGWESLFEEAAAREASLRTMPVRMQRCDRSFELDYRPVEAGGRVDRVILVISDVTEALAKERSELQLKAELLQALKLEAVGRLASGIAHELNTPIQFIGDNTYFIQEAFASVLGLLRLHQQAIDASSISLDVRQELQHAAGEADLPYLIEEGPKSISRTLEGVQRVATIVRAMKEFAHPDQKEMVATDLNRSLLATIEVARNEYKYVANVRTDFGDIPQVTCHAGDLNQVFLNIIVNAAHAIEDVVKGSESKGTIVVQTRQERDEVVIAISDTGGGIPEAIRDRIFDPFFTTKVVGRGTGQGLAIARSVVEQHDGTVRFETELGKGTTFYIRLPLDAAAV